MNYPQHQSIFIQIADRISERILNGQYEADSRIPSVRELAVEMEVNPNTVMRSFERLQMNEVVYNRRGLGYFVSPEAKEKIRAMRYVQFVNEVAPSLFSEMELLNMGMGDLEKLFLKWQSSRK